MRRRNLWAIFALLWLGLMAAGVQAAVVGRFTQVQGQVDLLKHGKIPAVPAQVNDGVEPGDVIRTKSTGKAQVKFVDDSLVTLAPESRMGVADFTYEAGQAERRAVLRLFKGVMHTVVTRLLKAQKPDFLTETHTAVLGVRGTEYYTVLLPNSTGAYLVSGLLEARSNNPQIPDTVLLHSLEFCVITRGQPPSRPRPISAAMLKMLKGLMDTGLSESALLGAGNGSTIVGGSNIPDVLGFPGARAPYMQPNIPPEVTPPALTPMTPAPRPAPGPTQR